MKTLYLFLTTIAVSAIMCKFSYAELEKFEKVTFLVNKSDPTHFAENSRIDAQKTYRQYFQEYCQKHCTGVFEEEINGKQPAYIAALFAREFVPSEALEELIIKINPDRVVEKNSTGALEGLNILDIKKDLDLQTLYETSFGLDEVDQKILDAFSLSFDKDLPNTFKGNDNKFLIDLFKNLGEQIVKNITSAKPKLSNLINIPLEKLYEILRETDKNSEGKDIPQLFLKRSILNAIEITLSERLPEITIDYSTLNTSGALVRTLFEQIFYRILGASSQLKERSGINKEIIILDFKESFR